MKQKTYDIVVVGGGCAGVAAALEAARNGHKVALVEKTVMWGGLATAGLVNLYMPLCDGKGKQVTFGLAEELLLASMKYGYGNIPGEWQPDQSAMDDSRVQSYLRQESTMRSRYMVRFSPASLVMAMDELLETAGVDQWVDTLFCSPVMKGDTVTAIEVENKSGRISIAGKCFIDATGDGDLAFRAGAPEKMLKGSLPFFMHHCASMENAHKAVETGFGGNLSSGNKAGANEWGDGYKGTTGILNGVDGKEVSDFILEGRKLARENLAKKQRELGENGRGQLFPTTLPSMAQFRMTRMIGCHDTVTDTPNVHEETSVGLVADCRQRGAVWEVPYGSLVPQKIKNLLVAGRCSDAEEYSWMVTRLIQGVALTGQVCGVAAGLAVENNTTPEQLEVKAVQDIMESYGVPLHYEGDVKAADKEELMQQEG